jgi:helix-turn-helix protein
MTDERHIEERLEKIEELLTALVGQRVAKEWYSTAEVAEHLARAEYTVREWCRLGRIRAKKKPCGRGKGGEWLVSHEELTRLRNEGLLPFQRPA